MPGPGFEFPAGASATTAFIRDRRLSLRDQALAL